VEVSPFPYQGPLEPDQVEGRDELVADLIERVTERRVTALIGPRRYGKTSLLKRVARDVERTDTSTVWLDLYEVSSAIDLAVRIDDALAASAGPIRRTASKLAATLEINLGLLKVGLARRGSRPEPEVLLHSRLDLLVDAALEHPTVLFIDEFSDIRRVSGFAGLLRTRLQHHFQDIGLLLAGSAPSVMRTLFTDRAEPFYGQADLVTVGPLDPGAIAELVDGGFTATGRDPGTLAVLIADLTGGHPQRTMQVADAAWRASEPGVPFTTDTWARTLEQVRHANASIFERQFATYSGGEKDVLRILATGGAVFGRAAALLDVSTGVAQHARAQLAAAGDIVEGDDGYRLTDPLLADWIRHRFPV
jgi:uncharacterized protein